VRDKFAHGTTARRDRNTGKKACRGNERQLYRESDNTAARAAEVDLGMAGTRGKKAFSRLRTIKSPSVPCPYREKESRFS